ncbi:VirB4 family type IV secretion/conjugal transfer ATPase, partial [Campylobacter coli]|uniref:VirB4 family type IV secretion/conjugal transfer ATPase n=1 Tax=Campylobacter coli TaxID=195 RepID=UPI000AB51B12
TILFVGRFNPIRVLPSPIDQYLNGNLQNIQFGHDTIQFNQNDSTKRFARCIEIKDYTNETFAGILDILMLSLIHISEPTRLLSISYAVFCLKKKKIK